MKIRLCPALALRLVLLPLVPGAVFVHAAGINDGNGKEWRQLTETRGLTWAQVAQIAPQDGVTPAAGSISARDLTGWVWATEAQVATLFSAWVPEILSSPSLTVAGPAYLTPASQFQSVFQLTQHVKGCPTYQPCFDFRMVAGWAARSDQSHVPVEGAVIVSADDFMPTASFQVQTSSGNASSSIGVFLWRPTGLHTGGIHANDDTGQSPSPFGGTAVNVLANDWLAGARPTGATVALSQVSPAAPGLFLLGDGSVVVAAGTAAGTHVLSYRIASLANPTLTDDATATITVRSFPLVAVADQGYAAFAAGGTPVANVLANDTLGAQPATTAVVRLNQVSSTNPGISLNVSTGAIHVAPGTPHGIHSLVYSITELAQPANVAQATVTIRPSAIDAVNDSARGSSKTGGTVIASVLANDWFNGARATTAKVRISLPATLPKGITLNLSTGAVVVAPKTNSGKYVFTYRLSEIASPANFDEATVTLDLSGKSP